MPTYVYQVVRPDGRGEVFEVIQRMTERAEQYKGVADESRQEPPPPPKG